MGEMSVEDRVIEAEKRLAAAHLTLDLGVIADLLHDDYVIVQPGGSVRDDENIARADELGLAMVLTGERQFLH